MGIEARKYRLMEQLMHISDEKTIKNLENIFQTYLEIIKEQNYKGADKKGIDNLIEDMAIEEPIEDLLKMI